MATFSIGRQLTANTGTAIVELLNVRKYYEELKREFPPEYWLDANYVLEALDLASNISDVNLAPAPFPATDLVDNQAQKAAKVADTWRNYPRIGLQLHLNCGNNLWIKKGQPIVIQNTPVQFPLPLISPYLNATSRVFLLGQNDRLGVSIIQGGNWQPIKNPDYITISGAFRVDIQPKELKQIPIKQWVPVEKNLPEGQVTEILPNRLRRRYLSLQNAGASDLYLGFTNDIAIGRGELITPKGTMTIESEKYYTESKLFGISAGEGKIVGQEGLI